MNLFRWYYSPFLILGAFWLSVGNANAAATCSASMNAGTVNIGSNLTSDNVDSESITATLNYKCSNGTGTTRYVSVCLAVDGGDIASEINPRYMKKSGTNTPRLAFTMLKPDQTLWGTRSLSTGVNSEYIAYHEMPGKTSISIDVPIKVALLPNYNNSLATPGVYTNNFNGGYTALTYQDSVSSTSPDCTSGKQDPFPFIVQATVVNSCEITTTNDVNLGAHPASNTNILGSRGNAIGVTCTKDAPYTIGLAPSNGNQAGSGVMSGTGSNTDKVPYQLRSSAGIGGTIWGNTATPTMVGNGVEGIGTGSPKSHEVFVTVPSADFRPDNYSDTVTIKVNY